MKRSGLAIALTASILGLAGCTQTATMFDSGHAETAAAQTLSPGESLRLARQQAWEAAVLVQNPPHPAERWQEARSKWQQAIRLLDAIPPEATVATVARKKLSDYRQKYDAITQRWMNEEAAIDNYAQAQMVAWQAAVTVQNPPHGLNVWQRASERWERALQLLDEIPTLTTVAAAAQQKKMIYRQNYQAIAQRIAQEQEFSATLAKLTQLVSQINQRQNQAILQQTEDPIGMTYAEYGQVVRSLQNLEQTLEKSPVAKTHPAYPDLQAAIADYRFAFRIWQIYERYKAANADWLQNEDFYSRLVPLPQADLDQLLQNYRVTTFRGITGVKVPLKSAVWQIWEQATHHADAAKQKAISLQ